MTLEGTRMRAGTGAVRPARILRRRSFSARRHLLALLLPAALLLVPGVSQAATRTWSGLGANSNWNTAGNWDVLPGSGDIAQFNTTGAAKPCTINVDPNVAGILIASGYTGAITVTAATVTIGASGYVQSGTTATFAGGTSAITISGPFTLSATTGTFTSTSGTMTVTGAFTHTTASTFTANGGTVALTGAAAAISVAATHTFNNLTIAKTTGVALTVTNLQSVLVAGTLTLTDGLINQTSLGINGSINAQGQISHAATFDGGTGQINITGAGRTIPALSAGYMPGVLLNSTGTVLTGPASGTTVFQGTTTSFTNTAGTVTGGAGAMTFNLNYIGNGGSFTGGAGTVTVTGTFTLSAGSFTSGTTTTLSNTFGLSGTGIFGGGTGATSVAGAATASGGTLNGGSGSLTFNGTALFSGATINGQTAAWNFNNTYTLSSGTYTATSNTTTFASTYTHTAGGTFTHNSGTATFSGAASTVYVTTSENFYSLTISKNPSVALTVDVSDTLNVAGTLTLTDGYLNQATIPATGTINVTGGITHGAGFDGGTGLINITGGATRTVNLNGGGVGGTSTICGVLLNTATVTLNGPPSGTTVFAGTTTSFNLTSGTVTGGAGGMTFNLNYTQGGGSFSGGAGTVTFTGTFTLSAGTFTATSGTTYFASTYTHTAGGTFSHNNGTANFTGAAATVSVTTSETFYNLTLSKSDGIALTVDVSDTLVVTGTLTLTDGYINQATIPLAGTIDAQAGVTHGNLFDGGTGLITIDGAATRTINLTGGGNMPGVLLNAANVTLNGPGSGTTAFQGTTTSFNLTTGTVTGGAGAMTFNLNYTQSGGSFTGGGGTLTFTGTFTLGPGAFTASSGNTYFASTYTHTAGGTFSHNSGTAIFTGAASSYDGPLNETFYNLTLSKNDGAALTVANGKGLTVNATLTLTDGLLNQSTIPIAGTIKAQGGITHGAGFDGGTGLINITNGATPRTINLTGGGNMPGVILNDANVTLNGPASGTTAFAGTATSFNLLAGTFTGGAGAITFNLNYTQSGGGFTGGGGTVTVTGTFGLSSTGAFTGGTATTFTGAATASGGTMNGGNGSLTFAAATFSGATVNGQTAAWNFNGVYTLSAGTFTASSGTTTFASDFTDTGGGTFSHNNGIVAFTGAAATASVNVTETFHDLTVGKNNGVALTVANSDTLFVTGTLTMTDGLINQTTIPAGGTIAARGDLTEATTFDGGTGSLVIDGAGNQLFTGYPAGPSTPSLPTVTVNKAGGILTLFNTVRTTNPWNISAGTVYTNLSVLTGTSSFTLSNGATLGIGSTAGITSSGNSGNIQVGGTRTFNTGANYIYNGTATQATGSGLPALVNGLTINNSTGVTLSYAGTTSVTTALTLQSGVLTAGSNVVDIPSTGSVTAVSGWVYATGSGGLQEWFAAGSNVAHTFYVGTATASNSVDVTLATVGSGGNLKASVTTGDHPNIATSDLNPSKSVNCYWTLGYGSSPVVFSSYDAVFHFNNPGDLNAGTDTSFLYAERYSSGWAPLTMGVLTSTSTEASGPPTSLGDIQIAEKKESKLVFVTQPSDTAANATITPAVTVRVVGANGEYTSSTALVVVAIGTNPSGGTLSGTKTRGAVDGLATFNDLSIDNAGAGYTLTAGSAPLTIATSNPFTIIAGSYYVDNSTGSDGNNGSQGAPFASIGKAVSLIGSGGTVYVGVGNSRTGSPYSANNVIAAASAGTAGHPTVVQGVAVVTAIRTLPLVVGTDPTADAGFDVKASYITVDSFEIQNTQVGVYAEASTTGIQVSGNIIAAPHFGYGIILDHVQASLVLDNTVKMISGSGSFFGIWDYTGNGNTIDGNIVTGIGTDGIASHYSTGLVIQRNIVKNTPLGIHVSHATGAVHLYNNTSDLSAWLGIYVEQSTATVTSRNNIVTNGLYGWGWDGTGTISSDYDDVYNNTHNYDYTAPVTPGAHSISANPNFVQTTDPTQTTYYLLNSGSPCVDTGVNVVLPYLGAAPDIGGVESH